MVVTQDIPRTNAMWHQTLLIFALRNVLPKPLHTGAVRGHWTSPILVGTLGGVAEQEKTLLLMTEDLLPVRYFARTATTTAGRPTGAAGWDAGVAWRHMLLSGNLRRGRGDLRHTRLRWHRPLTAAARHGIDIVHVDHVTTARPRGRRGWLLLLQRHGGGHRLSSARAPRHRGLRSHGRRRLLLLVLRRRPGHALAWRRRPLALRRGLLLPCFHSVRILGLHPDVHGELLQPLLQRRDVLVCLEGRGRPIQRFLEALGHLRELIQPFLRSVRFSLL
mmetsp:Transcript_29488/g.85820  ORF Transcript_29488/g.85820 Transcript_29488/m.85820 type:complete len:276 (-) Transcript_29488:522-1349(-)